MSGKDSMLVELSNHALILSVRPVAPILVVLILITLVLGFMARIFPQLNVFMLSIENCYLLYHHGADLRGLCRYPSG